MVRLTPVSSDVSTGVDHESTPPGAISLITVQAGRAKIVLALLKVSPVSSYFWTRIGISNRYESVACLEIRKKRGRPGVHFRCTFSSVHILGLP